MVAPITIGEGITIETGIHVGPFNAPAPNSVVAYYNAGDNASYPGIGAIWYDVSGQNNHINMAGSLSTWVSAGPASYFNTVGGGYFTGPGYNNIPIFNSNYTFAAWINGPGQGSWGTNGICSIGGFGTGNQSNAFRVGSYPTLINYWWANDLAVTTSAPATGWFYAVATFDGTTRSIYVNGVLQGSDTPTGHNVTESTINVATTAPGLGETLNGNIGQLWIYNFGLTDTDILANFNATRGTYGV